MSLEIAKTIAHVRDIVSNARSAGVKKIGLVPTMGGLHKGHISLIHEACEKCDHVIVSIFVNPTQFNNPSDFKNYPGDDQKDLEAIKLTGANTVFMPSAIEMYPDNFATQVTVDAASQILCDAHRPGHFSGVATIVTKLFLQTGADLACFGEKDYQQLHIVRRLVEDLNIPIKIHPVATMREQDGLAMSSRNARLTSDEREQAPALYSAMQSIKAKIQTTDSPSQLIKDAGKTLEANSSIKLEYLEMRSGRTLQPLDRFEPEARLFAAGNLGTVRLIDNIAL